MLCWEPSMAVFSHKMIFQFITICYRKIQYAPDRLSTFFPKTLKALENMSKILKTQCIFEYYTPESLWFMNFNNTPLILSANHSPKYLLMETCDRFCFAFILACSRICKGKHAHIRYVHMHAHTHETICYKIVLEELFQTTD